MTETQEFDAEGRKKAYGTDTCKTCGGSGVAGYDKHGTYPCPDCTPAQELYDSSPDAPMADVMRLTEEVLADTPKSGGCECKASINSITIEGKGTYAELAGIGEKRVRNV